MHIFHEGCEDVAQLKQKYKQVIKGVDEKLKESNMTKFTYLFQFMQISTGFRIQKF